MKEYGQPSPEIKEPAEVARKEIVRGAVTLAALAEVIRLVAV
jgi:carbonic anhydrase/acetyltransferase-like protein (isoleucine patch superfamily)